MDDWTWVGPFLLGGFAGWLLGMIKGHRETQAKIEVLDKRIEHLGIVIDREFTRLAEVNEALMRGGEELAKKPGFEALNLRDWKLARRKASLRRMKYDDADDY